MADDAFVPTFLNGLPLALDALRYARELHRGQRRSFDEAPFILHPLEVAALLHTSGYGEVAVTAAILHDAVEDTDVDVQGIIDRFGIDVGALVDALTEDPDVDDYEQRKAGLRRQVAWFGGDAAALYAADKVAKVRELRAQVGRDPGLLQSEDVGRRLGHYSDSLAMLEVARREDPLVQKLRFELEALRALPPHGT